MIELGFFAYLWSYLYSSPIDKTYQHMTIRDGTASAYHSHARRQAGRQTVRYLGTVLYISDSVSYLAFGLSLQPS